MSTADLAALERRVTEKWVAAAAERFPQWPDNPFSIDEWIGGADPEVWRVPSDDDPNVIVEIRPVTVMPPLSAPDVPQFPREQWASYPAKRTVCLLIADRLLDFDELTDEQWLQLCFLMQYGGKTRLG